MSLIKRLKKGITIWKAKKGTQDYTTATTDQIEQPHWRPSESYLHSKTALGNIVLEQPLKACRAEHNWIYHFGGQ